MTLVTLFAAVFTFTASATGVEKGTPIEFLFAGPGTDRDYETMFILDMSVDEFCKGIEACGIPRGKPVDVKNCVLWPVGCPLELSPRMSDFIDTAMPEGLPLSSAIYTGGTRDRHGACEASETMPLAAFCLYTLSQSPIVFDGVYRQGDVYNCHRAAKTLEKGEKVRFALSWDEKTRTKCIELAVKPGNASEILERLKVESSKSAIEALVDFSPELTVAEAVSVAKSLRVVDSATVKINGCVPGHLFYSAFMPMVSWLDPKERLVQPYELRLGSTNSLVFIEEDWSGSGLDPKLARRVIPFSEAKEHSTDTCFIYASPDSRLETLYSAMNALSESQVSTWYVYAQE